MTAASESLAIGPLGKLRRPGAKSILAALGVVYGDIGTSPLYAFKSAMDPLGKGFDPQAALGVASLVIWSLIMVVAVKYVFVVLRADQEGEGGILALTSLLDPWGANGPRKGAFAGTVILLGLFGCSLLLGDGIITPAISVLSAVEGLKTVFPGIETSTVLALAAGILVALFCVQRQGTHAIGRVFGPVMLAWFLAIGAAGAAEIAAHPEVLAALNPAVAFRFALREPAVALVFGAVFLALTGGEAMYADLGHCGRAPIRAAWFSVVMPALALNYLGQAAVVMADPAMLEAPGASPFFSLAPDGLRLPLVALATAATVIASQALISGVFSLVRQAVTLGLAPRFEIRQTRSGEFGQIYVPAMNWALMVGALILVAWFRSSDAMAAAYGIAVSVTMLITTVLIAMAMRRLWRWPLAAVAAFVAVFGSIDLVFVGSNMLKVAEGGWIPLALGVAAFSAMRVWAGGSALVRRSLQSMSLPAEGLGGILGGVSRVPGRVQVFLTKTAGGLPPVMCDYVGKTGSLAEHVVVLTFLTARTKPFLHRSGNVDVADLGHGVWRVTARYGYMQTPRVGAALREAEMRGLPFSCKGSPVILSRESVARKASGSGMSPLSAGLYGWMARNCARADAFFKIDQDRVMEVGVHIEI